MLKNNNKEIITRSKARSKSTARKPLREVSNGVKSLSKKKLSETANKEDGALDGLLLIHSDLSSLIHQIDELVVQALTVTSRKGMKEIESFANVLSEMQTSLEAWVPRFKKAVSNLPTGPENQRSAANRMVAPANKTMSPAVESPEPTKLGSLVSPSPLVSWRADCTFEGGRQLFLLTPLPKSKAFASKYQESAKSVLQKHTSCTRIQPQAIFDIAGEKNDDLLEDIMIKPTPSKVSEHILESKCVSPETFSKWGCMLVMTPRLKISPPKSCVLLEPISELPPKNSHGVERSTPFPPGVVNSDRCQDSASSSVVSEHVSTKFSEFLGINVDNNYGNRRKLVEESPNWLMSPPKTCILMEPPDDELLTDAPNDHPLTVAPVLDQRTSLFSKQEDNIQVGHSAIKKSRKQALGTSNEMVESTPMLKEPMSTIRNGKFPGENTLKKELWTKFEAATTSAIHFNPVPPKNAQKVFLDMLDEVS